MKEKPQTYEECESQKELKKKFYTNIYHNKTMTNNRNFRQGTSKIPMEQL